MGVRNNAKKSIPFLGKTKTCTTCADAYNQFRKRSVTMNNGNSEHCVESPKKRALSDITTNLNVQNVTDNSFSQEEQSDETLNLSPDSHRDMKHILESIVQNSNAGEFKLLLESQLKNNKRNLDARQRRWDPKIISICLGILLRSPQAYQTLKDSQLLILPSRRTLQYYKNVVKQKPGINSENLLWMKKQATIQNISDFGYHGGILIDEMCVQDDLVITKHGDSWDVVGFTDMGHTNNNIKVITGGKKKVELATHVLQYVFHGFTGFRYDGIRNIHVYESYNMKRGFTFKTNIGSGQAAQSA